MLTEIVNNGKGSQPKTERNMQILADYKNHIPVPEMVAIYGVSATVIYSVLARYGMRPNRKYAKKKIMK
jgi:hypothetical protein